MRWALLRVSLTMFVLGAACMALLVSYTPAPYRAPYLDAPWILLIPMTLQLMDLWSIWKRGK